jgi:cytochrome P450
MLTPEGHRNPYPRYGRLRELAPRHHSAFAPVWVLTDYEDCRAVLRDNRFGKRDPSEGAPTPEQDGAEGAGFWAARNRGDSRDVDPIFSRSLLRLNPPDHTRLRGLVSRGFTPRRVDEQRAAITAMTDELLDEMAAAGEVEVLDALGFKLPVRVIGELVGVPPPDRDAFRSLVRDAATGLEPGTDTDTLARAGDAGRELAAYFRALVAERHARPRDDLTSALIAVRDADDRLTEEEVIATLILIFAAGFETTTNLIGNGLGTLLTHPAELARLRADPSLVPTAVEEILRYQSPVQADARTALEPADIDGLPVAENELVITLLGAANRDPAVFDDPETFSIRERSTPVLSFASGIHYCLGASLARLEGQIVFDRLLDRFATIELLDSELAWRDTLVLRGLEHLHVRVSS